MSLIFGSQDWKESSKKVRGEVKNSLDNKWKKEQKKAKKASSLFYKAKDKKDRERLLEESNKAHAKAKTAAKRFWDF
jgi:L-lactate utilization protein LutB